MGENNLPEYPKKKNKEKIFRNIWLISLLVFSLCITSYLFFPIDNANPLAYIVHISYFLSIFVGVISFILWIVLLFIKLIHQAKTKPQLWFVIVILLSIPVTIIVFFAVIVLPSKIYGNAMSPTVFNGEYILVLKTAYFFQEPQRGDVILFKNPTTKSENNISRIVALPNETIRIRKGKIFVNNILIKDDYTNSELSGSFFLEEGKSYELSNDNYFVISDNMLNAYDSRSWGPIKKNDIIGKAWIKYWPINSKGLVK